jgi:hypothetical protein
LPYSHAVADVASQTIVKPDTSSKQQDNGVWQGIDALNAGYRNIVQRDKLGTRKFWEIVRRKKI